MENTEAGTWISMWINVEAKAFSLWSSVGWRPLALLVREPWNMRHFNTNACITAKRPHGPPDFWTRPNFSGSFEWKSKDCPEKETKIYIFFLSLYKFSVTSFDYQTSWQHCRFHTQPSIWKRLAWASKQQRFQGNSLFNGYWNTSAKRRCHHGTSNSQISHQSPGKMIIEKELLKEEDATGGFIWRIKRIKRLQLRNEAFWTLCWYSQNLRGEVFFNIIAIDYRLSNAFWVGFAILITNTENRYWA